MIANCLAELRALLASRQSRKDDHSPACSCQDCEHVAEACEMLGGEREEEPLDTRKLRELATRAVRERDEAQEQAAYWQRTANEFEQESIRRLAQREAALHRVARKIPRGSGAGGQTLTTATCFICERERSAPSTAFDPVCADCRAGRFDGATAQPATCMCHEPNSAGGRFCINCKLPIAQPATAAKLESDRCPWCGWPLAESVGAGCVRGNCSMRPLPSTIYDYERAMAEARDDTTREYIRRHYAAPPSMTAKPLSRTVRREVVIEDDDDNSSNHEVVDGPCPHARPSWKMCPHCNGINSIPPCPECGCMLAKKGDKMVCVNCDCGNRPE